MTRVSIPTGEIVKVGPGSAGVDPLTTNRSTRYRFDLLDTTGRKFGDLDGVSSGSIEWNANSAVKGGGRLVVSKANKVHDMEIRVTRNLPEMVTWDFETDIGDEWGAYDSATLTRDTTTFHDGAASMKVTATATDTGTSVIATVLDAGFEAGETYTTLARVLNPTSESLFMVSVINGGDFNQVAIPKKPDWQTVTLVGKGGSEDSADTLLVAFVDTAHEPGVVYHADTVSVYAGEATGFNGEDVSYAPFSWLHARVRPVLVVDGVPEQPLGVFIPSAPVEQWDAGGGKQEIELLDRTSVLSQDYVPSTYTVKKGTNVISAVRKVIASTGEPVGALEASSDTLSSDMMWGAGTNKLTIVNELLDAAGFFALWADGNGQFRAEKYHLPKNRPVTYELLDDEKSIYVPDMSVDRDIYDIPNRVIMTAQGSGQSEAWTAVATNRNVKSPFSYESRGRWITDVQLGIEATSQANLDNKAKARLSELTSTQATIEIQHAPVPGLKVNDVVRFRRNPADIDTLFTVTKTSVDFDPISLAKSSLTQVVDL